MRKLVTVRTVSNISPIEGADFIEVAEVDGWYVVVKKGEFSIGSKGVYFEIDSFLPLQTRFDFLKKNSYRKLPDGTEGLKLRTVRILGQVSQGLLMPLSSFPEITKETDMDTLTELLGVTKWEPLEPTVLGGERKGDFPNFIKKTDEPRIQNLPKSFFSTYENMFFEVTEKLDGTSMTIYNYNGEIGVCGRNTDFKEEEGNAFWEMFNRLDIRTKLPSGYAIQGELIGPGIQKNNLKRNKLEFYVFNVWDIAAQRYLLPGDRYNFMCNITELCHVPIFYIKLPIFKNRTNAEDILKEVSRYRSKFEGGLMEGMVFKSCEYVRGSVLSFKVISNEYLLKTEN